MGENVPRWFRTALAAEPEHLDTEVDGARVHLRCWGPPDTPGLVLVHGGAAHSAWWDHIGPFLAAGRVVALDLSGHGDSDRRPAYDLEIWAREVLGAAEAGRIAGPPLVIGHSMGGWIAATVGARYGHEAGGVVIVDSPLDSQPPEEARMRRDRGLRRYPDRAAILDRFVTIPPQEVEPYIHRHIAEQSVRETDGAWTWKFDPAAFAERVLLREVLPAIKCRAAFFRSEFGLLPPSKVDDLAALLGPRVPMVELPDAGHHPMLDQPLALVTALRMLIRQWAVDDLPD